MKILLAELDGSFHFVMGQVLRWAGRRVYGRM
jgi:hypothetical protein